MKKGKLRERVTFLKLTEGRDPDFNTPIEQWVPAFPSPFAAEVQDVLPSRGERLADGIDIASRPARVRMAFRPGINSAMRAIVRDRRGGERTMQIVAGPAIIEDGAGIELMFEEVSTIGGGT